MEYLQDDYIYKLMEKSQRDDFYTTKVILDTLKDAPEKVHQLLNYYTIQAEMYKQEKLRVALIQKDKESKLDFIKQIVTKQMVEDADNGGKKYIDTSSGKLSVRKKPGKVKIVNLAAIPDEYFKVEKKPILKSIKEAYNEGMLEDGAIEIETGYSLLSK